LLLPAIAFCRWSNPVGGWGVRDRLSPKKNTFVKKTEYSSVKTLLGTISGTVTRFFYMQNPIIEM